MATLESVRKAAEHAAEHRSCEHLDGAVPFVVCGTCGEAWGYHVGHEGRWQDCRAGLCDPVSAWAAETLTGTPDEATGACDTCGDYLYGEDETYGPYLNAHGTYCAACASHATRYVV